MLGTAPTFNASEAIDNSRRVLHILAPEDETTLLPLGELFSLTLRYSLKSGYLPRPLQLMEDTKLTHQF